MTTLDIASSSLVQKINAKVDGILYQSMTLGPEWKSHDEQLGIFHRDELKIGKKLGTGSFSHVYEIEDFQCNDDEAHNLNFVQCATRESLCRSVQNTKTGDARFAVKFLRSCLQPDPATFCLAAADLINEGQFLTTLCHPNIVRLHGWSIGGSDAYMGGRNDGYFLIMDRLYENLEERMERWKLEGITESDLIHETTRIGSQIAAGLQYLHEKNIIFRDLKPSNIGFDESDQVRIFDFGLCRELPPCGESSSVFTMTGRVGSLRYMAEECVLPRSDGWHRYGLSADIYSFGMVLYEMMSRGNKAYSGYTQEQHEEFACRQGQRPAIPQSWPILIQDLIERCWAKEVRDRPSAENVGLRLLDSILDLEMDEETRVPSSVISLDDLAVGLLTKPDHNGSMSDVTVETMASESTCITNLMV